eukprot:g37748.t1
MTMHRRAWGTVPGMRNFIYEDKLQKLGLFALGRRKQRGDLTVAFEIMSRLDRVDSSRGASDSVPGVQPGDSGSRFHHLRLESARKSCRVPAEERGASQEDGASDTTTGERQRGRASTGGRL